MAKPDPRDYVLVPMETPELRSADPHFKKYKAELTESETPEFRSADPGACQYKWQCFGGACQYAWQCVG